jgi:DNA helicase-2/ATP-dependent DNA helicase PcrA
VVVNNNFDKRFNELNKEQQQAVEHIDGPLVVNAGPGTGKTQLLTMRVENILLKADILPANILCLTFTDSAAENMRQRLYSHIGKSAHKVEFYTFHGFGTHVINRYREFAEDVPLKPIDEIGTFELIENLLETKPHTNPLTKKSEDSFYYIKYIRTVFEWIKKSGLSTKIILEDIELSDHYYKNCILSLTTAFSPKISKNNHHIYTQLFKDLKMAHNNHPCSAGTNSITELDQAIEEYSMTNSTKPITLWKKNWIRKNSKNQFIYIDQINLEKFKSTIKLYDKYQISLEKNGYFDYDDMILKAISLLQTNTELRLNIQEQYQYILVDEYQDTNGAQNMLLELVCNNPVYENSPNLMVVGDPNQAIFSFQGADITLLNKFAEKWDMVKEITLITSYRSGQKLLDFGRDALINFHETESIARLKSNQKQDQSQIINIATDNQSNSYYNLGLEIQRLISNGVSANEISVISKQHKYLAQLVPYLDQQQIPISYEKDNQILNNPKILELVDLIELVYAISIGNLPQINSKLSKIIAAEYNQINLEVWWNITLQSRSNNQSWVEIIESTSNQVLLNFWTSLKIIAKMSINSSFELIFSYLVGSRPIEFDDGQSYTMPWFNFYFNKARLQSSTDEFLELVSGFNKLNQYLNDWAGNSSKTIKIIDYIRFIRLINKDYISLTDTAVIQDDQSAVTLTTTYKAKGNEWDYVFVIDCHNKVWAKTRKNSSQQFSLPRSYKFIEPAAYQEDNLVNPFYVAVTRARKSIYLISYHENDKGTALEYLDWINQASVNNLKSPRVNNSPIIVFNKKDWQSRLLNQKIDYKAKLKPILNVFSLSATGLNSYLEIKSDANDFIFNDLLKVPQPVIPASIYGTAVHNSLSFIHQQFSNKDLVVTRPEMIKVFKKNLLSGSLDDAEFNFYFNKGSEELIRWHQLNIATLNKQDISEYKISNSFPFTDNTKLTGKIDLIKFTGNNQATLLDYKTSQTPINPKTFYRDIKFYRYKRQLLFYKILLDSIDFKIKTKPISIANGVIEFLQADDYGNQIKIEVPFIDEEVKRVEKLIRIVWKKIMNLDFIEKADYPSSLAGVIQLEDDLLSGKI